MGFLSDFFLPRNAIAESPPNANEGSDNRSGTAQQRGHAGVKGGASTSTPASRSTQAESGEEAEVNRQDSKKGGGNGGGGSGGGSGGGGNSSGIETKLRDCVSSNDVNPAKKQYGDCISNGKGDCTEELVTLAQRITQCAAPDKFGGQK